MYKLLAEECQSEKHSLPSAKIIPEIEWRSLSTVFHNTSLSLKRVTYSDIGLQIAS